MREIIGIAVSADGREAQREIVLDPADGVARVEVVLGDASDEGRGSLPGARRPCHVTVLLILVTGAVNESGCGEPRPAVAAANAPQVELSGTEILVLRHILEGKANKDIRTRMSISPKTLETHITSIYGSLRAVGVLPAEPSAEDRGTVISAARHHRFRVVPRLPRRRHW